ncbi:hypothetical protein ACFV8E_10325 [Streptomyces sp. NPDC059849]
MSASHPLRPLLDQDAVLMDLDGIDKACALLTGRLAEDPTDVRG